MRPKLSFVTTEKRGSGEKGGKGERLEDIANRNQDDYPEVRRKKKGKGGGVLVTHRVTLPPAGEGGENTATVAEELRLAPGERPKRGKRGRLGKLARIASLLTRLILRKEKKEDGDLGEGGGPLICRPCVYDGPPCPPKA